MYSRRSVLAGCCSLFGAGCLQRGPSDGQRDDAGGSNDGAGGDDGGSNGDDGERSDDTVDEGDRDTPEPGTEQWPYSVSVDAVEASSVYETADVARVEDYPPDVRAAIDDAIEGEYETDEPAAALARLVARYDRVAYEGATYELDASFPIHRLVLERVTYETVDEATEGADEAGVAGARQFRESQAATRAIQVAAEDGTYETVSVPELLEELVAEHGYVTMTGVEDGPDADYFAWRLERDDDGPPYELVANRVDDVDLPVTEYESLPEAARSEFDAARAETQRLEERPALVDALDGDSFVRRAGEYYRVSIAVA